MDWQQDFPGLSAHGPAVSHIEATDAILFPAPSRLWNKSAQSNYDIVDKVVHDISSKAIRKSIARLVGQAIVEFEAAHWEGNDHKLSFVRAARLKIPRS